MAVKLQKPFPVKSFRAGEFRPKVIADMMATLGARVLVEPAIPCACGIGADVDTPVRNCPVCSGEGIEYPTALNVETRALISGLEKHRDTQAPYGAFDDGEVSITLQAEQPPPDRSRITVLDSVMQMQVIRRRASSGVDVFRHPIVTPDHFVVGPDADDEATTGVLFVRKTAADGTGGAILTEGTDFAVTVAGAVDWSLGDALGSAPTAGTGGYAILYFARRRYVVTRHPHVLRQSEIKFKLPAQQAFRMPVQVFAKLDNDTSTRSY